MPYISFTSFALLRTISFPSLFLCFLLIVELRSSLIPLIALILSPGLIFVLLVIFLLVLSVDALLSSSPVRDTNSGTKYIISTSEFSPLLVFFSTSIRG